MRIRLTLAGVDNSVLTKRCDPVKGRGARDYCCCDAAGQSAAARAVATASRSYYRTLRCELLGSGKPTAARGTRHWWPCSSGDSIYLLAVCCIMSLRPGGFSLRPGGGGGFDEDERGGSFRPSGGSRPRSELDDSDRRSKGGGGRRGAAGGGRNSDDVLEGQLFLGEVVSLRESDRFGFIQPDAASGLPRTGALPLLPPPPPAAAASAAAACTRAARAHALPCARSGARREAPIDSHPTGAHPTGVV